MVRSEVVEGVIVQFLRSAQVGLRLAQDLRGLRRVR